MTASTRQAAFVLLNSWVKDGVLERGRMAEAGRTFSVHHSTMTKFWRDITKKIADENVVVASIITNVAFFENNKKATGRLPKWDRPELRAAVARVPKSLRKTFRSLSSQVAVPKSTLFKMMAKEGMFRRNTSSLKPHLTDENKAARFAYALEEVYPVVGQHDGELRFKNMYDRVDIDEKWFYLSRKKESYILIADHEEDKGEDNVYRSVRNVNHLTMVMFLCAQARPRWDHQANQMWDGKIGIWPIGGFVPAERSSVNRPRGAPVWWNESVTKDVYRSLLLDKVIPAIKLKWPRTQWEDNSVIIRLQQDGAPSHISPEDEAFQQGLVALEVQDKILIYTQPANSPDTNINDLGFFRALQSRFHENCPRDEAEIIQYVSRAYDEYDCNRINDIWLTLMAVLNLIIENLGGNNFELPHMNKNALRLQAGLPVSLIVTDQALEHLDEQP